LRFKVPAASKALLLNPEILAIDQDKLGRMAFRYSKDESSGLQVAAPSHIT